MEKSILFDAERMKFPHTGLYHFCLHLGQALKQRATDSPDIRLTYYTPKGKTFFGSDAEYLAQHSLHKFLRPSVSKYKLWHSTYQLSHYLPRFHQTEVVLTIHDLNFLHEGKAATKQQKYLNALQQNIDRASSIVSISKFVQTEITEYMNIGNKPIHVIPNGCTINEQILPQRPSRIPITAPFFFSIGTVARKKNFHVLPALLVENDYQLVISGIFQDEKYKEEILLEAKKLGVLDRVLLTGPVSEAEKYWLLKHCALFCFPSLAEGFGLPVIEAMYFGTPVFISKETSLPEIGGDDAFYMDSFDFEELAKQTTAILHKLSTMDVATNLRKRASQFNWDTAADSYWRIYNDILALR